MRRRDFIALAGWAASWPLVARAQQSEQLRRIGILMSIAKDPSTEVRITAFKEELKKLRWTDGVNVQIDVRWGGGDLNEIRRYATALVALPSDVILASGVLPTQQLEHATRTVPIVFVLVVDPVGNGLVESLARPGGNATGFTQFEFSMCGKWVELLKQIAPSVTRVGVLHEPSDPGQYAVIQATASSLGMQLAPPIRVSEVSEIERGITTF